MTQPKTQQIVLVAMFSAVAFVISFFEMPLLGYAPFLKIDLSDLPIFIGMYVLGPLSGGSIAFIRSLLQYVSKGGEMGYPIGATASFLASIAYLVPFYAMSKMNKWSQRHIVQTITAGVIATLSLTVVMIIVNYIFILPAYLAVMGFSVEHLFGTTYRYILVALIPFNFIKGIVLTLVITATSIKLMPWLNKMKQRFN